MVDWAAGADPKNIITAKCQVSNLDTVSLLLSLLLCVQLNKGQYNTILFYTVIVVITHEYCRARTQATQYTSTSASQPQTSLIFPVTCQRYGTHALFWNVNIGVDNSHHTGNQSQCSTAVTCPISPGSWNFVDRNHKPLKYEIVNIKL